MANAGSSTTTTSALRREATGGGPRCKKGWCKCPGGDFFLGAHVSLRGVCQYATCQRKVRQCACDAPKGCKWKLRCKNCHGFNPGKQMNRLRFAIFHEELMAAAWHPRRVEAWLAQGEHVLDMMMGVD